MKRFLQIVGGIFLAVMVVGVAFIGFAVSQGHGLDASCKAYVAKSLPPILSSWSTEELIKRSSPQLLEVIRSNPGALNQLFQKLSKLGRLQHIDDINGTSNVSYTTQEGKVISASYIATARFQNGDATINIRLLQTSGQWQFAYFYVNSPIFLQ